ncbi:MAG: DNA cytosine methyltransferase [Planctomycetes bacterium]|nr:DNA cytosine methyltransferase [Planctomycetota bacterium]
MVKRTASVQRRRQSVALDLFSGCGGLSLGFRTAGFEILGGIEIDPTAAATHGMNFHPDQDGHGVPMSVDLEPGEALARLGLEASATKLDVLIGGPPCQAFARVGRAKLRSESARRNGHDDDRAWLEDPRVGLYARYLNYVDTLQPRALLMENVPDVLNHGGVNVAEQICDELDRHGYESSYTLLNAVHYGVPQMRERMFLVAYRKDLRVGRIRWPSPTHRHELPHGYAGTRSCALRPLNTRLERDSLFEEGRVRYEANDPDPSAELPPAVTVSDALADLPLIRAMRLLENGDLKRGVRRLDRTTAYRCDPVHAYARLMRFWPNLRTKEGVTGHEIRYLPRDYRIFRWMKPGDQYPQAYELARTLFDEHLQTLPHPPAPGSTDYRALEAAFVPPYDPTKFPNKWRKMERHEPSRTLMAHLGKDSYSHIHYDSAQARTISVREAARLQSFPDGFSFCGSMNAGFRQIGNAVPPLLAYALARQIRKQLGLTQKRDIRAELKAVHKPTPIGG